MAQPAFSTDPAFTTHEVSLPSSPAAILRLSGESDAAGSPARDLHDRLLRSFQTAPSGRDDRLPLNTRLAIIAAATAAPWALIGAALYLTLA